jgi:hypothetical protein
MEAEADAGQISLFGSFSQSSHESSGNPPSLPLQCKKSPQRNSSNRGHEVDDDEEEQFPEDEDNDADDGGGGRGGGDGKRKSGRY